MKNYIIILAFLVAGITSGYAQEESKQETLKAHFSGEMIGLENETFKMSILDDVVNLDMSIGKAVFNITYNRTIQHKGVDVIIYAISNVVSYADPEWKEFRIFDLRGHNAETKQTFASGVPTARDYIIRISGTPVLGFMGDLDYGKL